LCNRHDSYEFVRDFVLRCHEVGGINHFIVHARKAILEGLSPKQNRSVPPLNHAVVLRLKQELPHLHITINGGFRSADDIRAMIGKVDGVMVGRASYESPFVMSEFDAINQEADPSGQYLTSRYKTRAEVATAYAAFIANEMKSQPERKMLGVNSLLRPLNDLFHGLPRARKWREFLSTHSHKLPIEELVAQALQLTEKGE
jgi:tRNA-dihydrouridine synthase A